MAPCCSAIAQESFVVSFYSNYQRTPNSEEASLMSIMTMARHGRHDSLASRCLRVVEGFAERFSDVGKCGRRSSDLRLSAGECFLYRQSYIRKPTGMVWTTPRSSLPVVQ